MIFHSMRFFAILLPAFFLLLSCAGGASNDKSLLAVTMEPYRFIVEAVAGDDWQVVSVVPRGSSPETFDPSPARMMLLDRCKGYFAVGGLGFEQAWNAKIARMFPSLPLFDTSVGIERIDDDPHLWTSPDNMILIARNICSALCGIDTARADAYKARLQVAEAVLCGVDSTIHARVIAGVDSAFLVFHPSLTYFARRYGLRQIALEEHGKEPSAAHMKEIIDEARRQGVRKVFVQAEFDKKHAESVARELDAEIITIDPLNYDWCGEMLRVADKLKNNE